MSRSEVWTTRDEIKRNFPRTDSPECGAGTPIFVENGVEYTDSSESHMMVIGNTGKGKSQCASMMFLHNIIAKNESAVVLETKGDFSEEIPDHYQKIFINLRDPLCSPTCWGILNTIYRLYKSESIQNRDVAGNLLHNLASALYPEDVKDPFWPHAAAEYMEGILYTMFDLLPEDQINFETLNHIMAHSDERAEGTPYKLLKALNDLLPDHSPGRNYLSSYLNAPNETRGSIHSVAITGLKTVCRSIGMSQMLNNSNFDLVDLDVNRPFVMYIILPDETTAYDGLAGVMINITAEHLIRTAQKQGGRLPIRVNFVLEELGSVGKCMPELPRLLAQGRSRNLRMMLILQSYSQLDDIYGKSNADAIRSCVDITIGFSTNSWETLSAWAERCGEKTVYRNGLPYHERLTTPAELAAMPAGTALVIVQQRFKFISRLPFYYQCYPGGGHRYDTRENSFSCRTPFNLAEFVRRKKAQTKVEQTLRERRSALFDTAEDSLESPSDWIQRRLPTPDFSSGLPFSIVEEDEKGPVSCEVLVRSIGDGSDEIIEALARAKRVRVSTMRKLICNLPLRIYFTDITPADRLITLIIQHGGLAVRQAAE